MENPYRFNFAFFEPIPQIPMTEQYDCILTACNEWSEALIKMTEVADYTSMRASLFYYALAVSDLREYESKSINELMSKKITD